MDANAVLPNVRSGNFGGINDGGLHQPRVGFAGNGGQVMEERNIDRINDILEKAKSQGWLDGFDFSILMQRLLIPNGGYIIDTGNWENVNAEAALMLYEKIKRHPILWRLFFML